MIKISEEHQKGRGSAYIGQLIFISKSIVSVKTIVKNLVNGDPEHGKSTLETKAALEKWNA